MSGDDGLTDDIDSPALSKRPATVEAPEVWAHMCQKNVQSLLFCDSRKLTELSVNRAKRFISDPENRYQGRPDLASYHAGHGKQSRRGQSTSSRKDTSTASRRRVPWKSVSISAASMGPF